MKKPWLTPEFYILSQDPLQAKHVPNIHEGTAHYVTLTSIGYKAVLNSHYTAAFPISVSGARVHNLTSLAS